MRVLIVCGALALKPQLRAAADDFVLLQYRQAQLSDVLHVYSTLTQRKVWVELGLSVRDVSVMSERPIPRAEALALIRATLLDSHGVEIRDYGDSEAFVTRAAGVANDHPPRRSPGDAPAGDR